MFISRRKRSNKKDLKHFKFLSVNLDILVLYLIVRAEFLEYTATAHAPVENYTDMPIINNINKSSAFNTNRVWIAALTNVMIQMNTEYSLLVKSHRNK